MRRHAGRIAATERATTGRSGPAAGGPGRAGPGPRGEPGVGAGAWELACGGQAAGAGLGERPRRGRDGATETEGESSGAERDAERGEMRRRETRRAKTRNYREIYNETEARGVHRTMFVVLHRDFFSFVIFL